MGFLDNIMGYFAGIFNILLIPLIIALIIPKISIKKRIIIFITVFIIIWILSLNVNPYDLNANNKYTILQNLDKKYIPKMSLLKNQNDIMNVIHNFQFPIIVKPIICSKCSKDVMKFDDKTKFLNANLLNKDYMVQEMIQKNVELGILVEKMPYEKYVKIISIVEKSGNSVVRKGCEDIKCINRNDLIFILEPILQKLSAQIPNFNVGRYDIRSSEEDLHNGVFKICEVNGTMGFDLQCWTQNNLFKSFYYHERWFISRVIIGFINICMGKGYNPIHLIKVMCITLYNSIICKDYEKLYALYT